MFAADDGTHGTELWTSDGTDGGTSLLKDINPGGDAIPPQVPGVEFRDSPPIYFAADDGATGTELWKTDGTTAGTVPVADVNPGSPGSSPSRIVVTGLVAPKSVFFVADDGTHGVELWRSGGSAGDTALVEDIAPGPASSDPQWLTWTGVPQAQLYFTADDGVHGRELWRSDGTPGGTVMVADIDPAGSSDPSDLVFNFGSLLFAADDGVDGREPWESAPTATHQLADLNPSGDSSPTEFTATERNILFAATEPSTGRELWGVGSNPATAVALRSFTARRSGRGVLIRWRTATEIGSTRFDVYRGGRGDRARVNPVPVTAAGAVQGRSYAVRDTGGRVGARYWLRASGLGGVRWYGPVTAGR